MEEQVIESQPQTGEGDLADDASPDKPLEPDARRSAAEQPPDDDEYMPV